MKSILALVRGSFWLSMFLILLQSIANTRAETQVIAWGKIYGANPTPPAGLTNIVAMAAGDSHLLALRADGTVVAWGLSIYQYGQGNIPVDATNVVAIAAGTTHSLALRGDGTVLFWGTVYNSPFTNAPPEAGVNFTGLAPGCGADHVLQLRMDGRVLDWGNTNSSYQVTNVPASATNVVSVAAGGVNAIALRSNGTVVGWGKTYSGTSLPVPASATNVVAIAAGAEHNLALRSNGTVVAWCKDNSYGRLTVPASATNITALACGYYFNLALRGDGKVLGWGDNGYGQTNIPATLSNVVDIAGGSSFSLALQVTDGPPLLGRPFVPPAVAGANAIFRIKAISSTPVSYQWTFYGTNLPGATNASLVLPNVQFNQAGNYSVIVSNAFGVVTNSDMMLGVVPVLLTVTPKSQTALVGANVQLAVTAVGQTPLAYQWRLNGTNLAGMTTNSLTLTNVQPADAGTYSVSVSNTFGGVVTPDAVLNVVPTIIATPLQSRSTFPGGTATFSLIVQANIPLSYQWQFNGTNLPGATSNSLTLTNVQYPQAGIYSVVLSNAFEIFTNNAALAVSLVAGWGDNRSGQLLIPPLTNVVAIASGAFHGLALKKDGSVTGWGSNNSGQTNVPPDLTNVMAIAGGGSHSLALKRDGTVTAWGNNDYGQTNPPPDLTSVVAIAGGDRQSLALKADGTLVVWGYPGAGLTNVPANLTNVVAIAAGYAFDLILKADGTVLAWGSNNSGQTNTPSDLTNVVGISAGAFHATATTSDGRIVSWGKYAGSSTTYTPAGLSNPVAISDGWESSMAVTENGSVIAWGRNSYSQTNVPAELTNVRAITAGSYHNFALINEGPPIADVLPLNPTWSNGVFSVSVQSQSGHVYRLEYKDSLSVSDWTSLPLVAGNGSMVLLTDPAATSLQRFYRVRRW